MNGAEIEDVSEYFIFHNAQPNWITTVDEYTLSGNEFFVMGDNRKKSLDSRTFGPINKDKITAKFSFKLNAIRYWLFLF